MFWIGLILAYISWLPGLISPNFFRPSKMLLVHKKYTVQFHQQLKLHITSLNWHTFYKNCLLFAKLFTPKKRISFCLRKISA